MATIAVTLPLVVIVGPTASGKSALAVQIALQFDGEVVCADSRTVYSGMDIGTAKPGVEDKKGVPHWGLDLVEPGERYTAAAWQSYAREKIADIRTRGRLPIVVGGTGLYVDGLIFDYNYPSRPSAEQVEKFESMSLDELSIYCIKHNIELPENNKNKRHMIRAAYRNNKELQRRDQIIEDSIVVGIAMNNEQLRSRIDERIEQMFADGVVKEARNLGDIYGWDSEAMTGNIYPLLPEYVHGEATIDEAKNAFRIRDRQLAKRQMTWFRRNPYILWGTHDDCAISVGEHLAR